jgi:nucleotide-binding universal stress UspA family protein
MSPQGSQPVHHEPSHHEHTHEHSHEHGHDESRATTPHEPWFPSGAVVVGVDGSPSSIAAVEWAAQQATLEHRPLALLHTFHVEGIYWLPAMGYDPGEIRQLMREDGGRLLDAAEKRVGEIAPEVEVWRVHGDADARTALIAASHQASMVVLGSRGRGPVASTFLGSVSVTVLRHATCPVVVRRPEHDHVSAGVLVGTDLSESSRPVLEYAYRLAALRHLPLTVLVEHEPSLFLHAEDVEAIDRMPRERVAQWMTELHSKFPDVRVTEEESVEPLVKGLVRKGTEKDVVVVGGHGTTALAAALRRSAAVTVVETVLSTVVVVPEVPAPS